MHRNSGVSLLAPPTCAPESDSGPRRTAALTSTERVRNFRARKRARLVAPDENIENTDWTTCWDAATTHFNRSFLGNEFGHACDICDRLWHKNDLKNVKEDHIAILSSEFNQPGSFKVCANCYDSLNKGVIHSLSTTNGFRYPTKPSHLPVLDPVSLRLISPRLPFMAIIRLRRDGQYGIIGQIINVPVSVDTMVNNLPRDLNDDFTFHVSIKKRLIHKTSYLRGLVQKSKIKQWLEYLIDQPLYRRSGIKIDWTVFDQVPDQNCESQDSHSDIIEDTDRNRSEVDSLNARQHTLMWNEAKEYQIAPGQNQLPLSLIFDEYAEELSFPSIYYGCPRVFKLGISVTPYMMANSEIRRKDRRGATPEHVLYMAMKIIRLRVVDGIFKTFRCISSTENITRKMLEDRQYLEDCIERNFAFLKTLPNSAQYWGSRKRDLFAMLRQLGKPTCFLTISANEMNWPDLLRILHKYSERYCGLPMSDPVKDLDKSVRSHLVNEDPVICCIYFNKFVDVIMQMISAKKNYNPFGRYRVKDYFMRIEFQHRGSPHAHIMLWMENDPAEVPSENMPRTVKLINDLFSVDRKHLDSMYSNQVHRHTFTCTKRGETSCRFNIPYWPMEETRVLLPMSREDNRFASYKSRSVAVKETLSTMNFQNFETFLTVNKLNREMYLNIIRSSLTRPTVLFKRDMSEIYTNTFHPWIAKTLNSNMDIQFILDEYSCASYVVDYVNKANRGTGDLHRELLRLSHDFPELSQDALFKKIAIKVINHVELSAQEAAWILLRHEMSHASRKVVYIPTTWPEERQKSHKKGKALQVINPESTDIWTESLIEKYEKRPEHLNDLCLADFAAWYSSARTGSGYFKRDFCRVIRYRNYSSDDDLNHKREMVLLYVPFRNEHVEILDRQKFLAIYETNIASINRKRLDYEKLASFERLMEEYQKRQESMTEKSSTVERATRELFVQDVLPEGVDENFDDFEHHSSHTIAVVGNRQNVLTKEEYCSRMSTTNPRQRELILEVIHRLHSFGDKPLQIYLAGPAGCGKTYELKLIMETYNRYSQTHNRMNNTYLACASTGKAAVNLGGTTVHSAFHITQSRRRDRVSGLAQETLQQFRQNFHGIKCIIIDEISMLANVFLKQVSGRLQDVTGEFDSPFGGMDMIICGDFKQLPPVFGEPVYKGCRDQLQGSILWQSLDYFELNQVMRQSDTVFSSILTKIGNGHPLTESEAQLIESRFRTKQWCDENVKDAIRLYDQNRLVDGYNRSVIQGGIEHIAQDYITGYTSHQSLVASRARLHKMSPNDTGCLAYNVILATGYPYLITTNIDIEDGLVNGSLGILRYIEEKEVDPNSSSPDRNIARLWFEFGDKMVGSKARLKHRAVMYGSATAINQRWTPVSQRSAGIQIDTKIKCRRTQFPVTPACAMTVHKSQGGTFDRAVISYRKELRIQLVYVALSRVTNIDGLFLTNEQNDFVFHHKFGSESASVREVRDEYARLKQYPLSTLTRSVENFLSRSESAIIICTINAQSLVAHYRDIETDHVITSSDFLAVTETWMNEETLIDIDGFELITSNHSTAQPYDQGVRRSAGGTAIYQKRNHLFHTNRLHLNVGDPRIGDASALQFHVDHSSTLTVYCIYLHPKVSRSNMEAFLLRTLTNLSGQVNSRMIVTGDFNCNIKEQANQWLLGFMRDEFNLTYVSHSGSTTLGNTCIDLTFVGNTDAECMTYISYFSYHRPIFNKISIK